MKFHRFAAIMYHFDDPLHHQGPVYGNPSGAGGPLGLGSAGMYGSSVGSYPTSSSLQNAQSQYSVTGNHCGPGMSGQSVGPGDGHKRDKDAIYR